VLIGAPGTGKSSVLEALTSRLEARGIEHGAIESEELGRGWPWLAAESWLAQLAAVLALQREAGRRLFLIVATTETTDELRGVLDALGADQQLVVCLHASSDTVASRIAQREPDRWPGKRRLIAHARKLALTVPQIQPVDLGIQTDHREPDEVAAEIEHALITLM